MGQMEALAPQSARDLLAMLVAAGLLRLHTAAPTARHSPPAIFGASCRFEKQPLTVCISQSLPSAVY